MITINNMEMKRPRGRPRINTEADEPNTNKQKNNKKTASKTPEIYIVMTQMEPTEYKQSLSNDLANIEQNNTTTTAEDSCFGMSTIQRYVTSIVLVILAFVCFSMSLVTLPFLAIQPTKFAFSYSMGSFLVILRFFNIL